MKQLKIFRTVAFWEGISYLLLLGVAMPLKYYAGMPKAVSTVGMAHGVLFLLYLLFLYLVWHERDWKLSRVGIAFIASLLPFGTMVFDKSLKREIDAEH